MQKSYLFILVLLLSSTLLAQEKRSVIPFNTTRKKANANQFIEQQWWLGFKAGINWAKASPIKRYTILTPTNYDASLVDKKYDSFKEIGFQTTIEITYYYHGFYFSVQPSYINSIFTYSNQLKWINSANTNQSLTQNYSQSQKVEYADFPFYVKYDITGRNLRPFVQLGMFCSVLLNAQKSVTVSSTDIASGGTNQIDSQPLITGAKDLFGNYWGFTGGAGATYQMGNVRLTLEANYRQSLANIVNAKNRFGNDRLSGIGDAQDDLNLKNIVVSAGVLFPMRYLSTSFKSNDRN